MLLRGGQRTPTPMLDRIPYFDPRSKQYPIRATLDAEAATPRSYTWALGADVLDQGQQGSCVGHGITHELMAKPMVVTGLDSRFAREDIYWEAQKVDDWEGGSYPDATPFYEGTAVLAGAKVAQRLGHFSAYRWAFNLADLVAAVGSAGPAVIGVHWYEAMFRPDADGYISPAGDIAGGHCVVVLGVSLTRREFLIANSWGTDWSLIRWPAGRREHTYQGFAKVTFDSMERLLGENGEACIPVRNRVPVP